MIIHRDTYNASSLTGGGIFPSAAKRNAARAVSLIKEDPMSKPLIGLTPGHNTETQDLFMRPAYLEALTAAGALPVVLPLDASPEDGTKLAQSFDGFLFTGGPDPHPFLFGEETHRNCGNISPRRDAMETALLSAVMKEGKPVLGICRGIQIINVALGGNIYQDIPSQYRPPRESGPRMDSRSPKSPAQGRDHDPERHRNAPGIPGEQNDFPIAHSQPCGSHIPTHTVTLAPKSRLARICGSPALRVNSMHHQAVRDLAKGLTASALAPDGLIEAIEMAGYPWLIAVQWHPEYLREDPANFRIFQDFTAACRTR